MSHLNIDYTDIVSVANPVIHPDSEDENTHWSAEIKDWGSYSERNYSHNHIRIQEIQTNFKGDVRIQVQDGGLSNAVHICMPLAGAISTNFHSLGLHTALTAKQHHHLYVPTSEYELRPDKKTHIIHIEIEKQYFTSLIDDAEVWPAALREKLLLGQMIHSGERLACPAMQNIISELFNGRLKGYLNKIFIEGKVLELIALQLQHASEPVAKTDYVLKKQDREILAAIYEHLTDHFTEEQTLQRLSRTFGMNEFKLKKGFKAVYGQTIFNYIFDLKMNHARSLLLDSGKLICEVSRDVGYKNPNHFSTAFKKRFGVNPVLLRQ